MNQSERYDGKPFLRLLEFYILRIIGELGEDNERNLRDMTPRLREIYGHTGSWNEIIATIMTLSKEEDEEIVRIWEKNRLIAKNSNSYLSPEEFARLFVDENLVG